MKFLTIWHWSNENTREVAKRYMEWKDQGNYKVLYPDSTMVGRNKAFNITEADDLAEVQKDLSKWTDLCTFEIIPIMDSREAVAVSRG